MVKDAACAYCGERIPPGESECPECARHGRPLQLRRDWLLLAMVISITLGLFVITHYVNAFYHARQRKLARVWYERGDAELRRARYQQAVSDLRTALAYSRENFSVRLRLAEALSAAQQQAQAQAYLQALWEEQPANGTVNLELARLAVARGDAPTVMRYYHGAIYGVWQADPVEQRRKARLELVEFLLQRGERQNAESELIALLPDLPRNPDELVRIGAYFLQAGDAFRALEHYTLAARLDSRNPNAFRGAARAALQELRFAEAERYAQQALKLNPGDTGAAALLRTVELVQQLDPTPQRLSVAQRAARLARAVEQAQYRLESCAAQKGVRLLQSNSPAQGVLASDYTQLLALKPHLRPDDLRQSPELPDTVLQAVYRSEADAQAQCGPPSGPDYALLLLGRRHGGGR